MSHRLVSALGLVPRFLGQTYNEVEGGKKFQPTCLSTCEDFGGGKVLKVPVVGNDVDWHTGVWNPQDSVANM